MEIYRAAAAKGAVRKAEGGDGTMPLYRALPLPHKSGGHHKKLTKSLSGKPYVQSADQSTERPCTG